MSHTPPGIVLFSHGSRDPLWRAPIEAVAARICEQYPGRLAQCAYLELCEPTLMQAVDFLVRQGANHVMVVPMFLGTGKHARNDLPVLVEQLRETHPSVHFTVQGPIGEDNRMTALMAEIACAPSASPSNLYTSKT